MTILITALIAGNLVGVVCTAILAHCQCKYDPARLDIESLPKPPDKDAMSVDDTLSVVDVSLYIIQYLHRKGHCVNILNLESILYYVQAQFAVSKRYKRCFKEKIYARDSGVEIPRVRDYFCGWGIMDIKVSVKSRDVNFSKDQRNLIDLVLDKCISKGFYTLPHFIRCQTPWREALKSDDHEITVESLREFFLN